MIIDRSGDIFVIDRLKVVFSFRWFISTRTLTHSPRKEILKVRGFQVAPAELEGHLLDHPAVSDVCIVGVKDDYSGELPFAFVVPSPSAVKQIARGAAGAEEVKQSIMKVKYSRNAYAASSNSQVQ